MKFMCLIMMLNFNVQLVCNTSKINQHLGNTSLNITRVSPIKALFLKMYVNATKNH